MIENLAVYRKTSERIRANWKEFLQRRQERLRQRNRHGVAAEKVAENILEDLFTLVLDWNLGDLDYQVQCADLLLTSHSIKYLLLEAKRPNALAWNKRAVECALDQAARYASEQKVRVIAVSDGIMLYAADILHGGLQDRVFVSLESPEPQEDLWWLSVHGIYRARGDQKEASLRLLPEEIVPLAPLDLEDRGLLHPKYKLPARCFAYVGSAADVHTWKLPYLLEDGGPDTKRLPKAIQAVITNYRGARVSGMDEKDIPEILVRLARAAASLGKMPHQCGDPAPAYAQLAEALDQFGRLEEVMS